MRRKNIGILDTGRILKWKLQGSPVPPPHIYKQYTVKKYGARSKFETFVETGLLFGDLVNAIKEDFNNIFSIELNSEYCEKAKARFHKYPHIRIINGDSGRKLKEVLEYITAPCLFWLDAHPGEDATDDNKYYVPVLKELEAILSHHITQHAILIDDARLFNGSKGYPTVQELVKYVTTRRKSARVTTKGDIIRIECHA
jgi:hypothetical protein